MPEEIAERIRLELNVLDGKVPVPPLEQDDAAMQDAAPAAPVRPAAKRPRATSPLPDYEDDEPPAKREPEQSAIEMFRAATEQQKRDAEAAAAAAYAAVRASVATAAPVVLAAPKPQPNRASTLQGLSEHESYVFMPLVQTLRAMHADGQPESLCSQAGSELRARFPDVYARDGNYAKWKTYVSRAEELGIVTLSQGRKQGGEAIRLNWQVRRSYAFVFAPRHMLTRHIPAVPQAAAAPARAAAADAPTAHRRSSRSPRHRRPSPTAQQRRASTSPGHRCPAPDRLAPPAASPSATSLHPAGSGRTAAVRSRSACSSRAGPLDARHPPPGAEGVLDRHSSRAARFEGAAQASLARESARLARPRRSRRPPRSG
ncbi:hypothetical protein JCM10449v2_000811 [Rhodotorula kratochvilovae]